MTDKKTRIVSNLLSLVLGAGIGAGVYAIKEQITHGGNERVEMEAPSEDVGGGVIFNEPEGNGMQLTATKLLSSEYDEYGVSELAETAYTLTATVTPANAMNKEVDWSVSFVDPTSAWASGKSVTEYVTVTPSADGALTATVENLDAFGAQIKITVASRFNADVKAETTVDYAKRITASNLKISRAAAHGSGYDFTEGMDPMPYLHPCMEHSTDLVTTTYTYTYGIGTTEDEFSTEITLSLTTAFITKAANAGITVAPHTKTLNESGFSLGPDLCTEFFGESNVTDVTKLEKLYNLIRTDWGLTKVFTLNITCTGEYSAFTKKIDFSCSETRLYVPASAVNVNFPAVVF